MNKLVVIAGTNASGKSDLGVRLAHKYNGEIISADSRQVFEGLNLGSGKITQEEMQDVPHHLIDVAKPNDFFSLADYQKLAYEAIDGVCERGRVPFLVGGTGLYVNAVTDGYCLTQAKPDFELRHELEEMSLDGLISIIREKDEKLLETLDLKNHRRLERAAEKLMTGHGMNLPSVKRYETLVIGVSWPREILYKRIEERLDRRLSQGMIEEVEDLIANGATDDFLYRLGLEYRYILMYLRGRFDSKDAFREELFKEIRHLGKEQMTWFRKRKDINWIDMQSSPFESATELIDRFLEDEL